MSAVATLTVRRLQPHEAALHRQVRLRALPGSPGAQGSTYDQTAGRSMVYWQHLTRRMAASDGPALFLAFRGRAVVGCAYGLRERRTGHVSGLWAEGEGAAAMAVRQALVEALAGWGASQGLEGMCLWAEPRDPAALDLYRESGFRPTGRRRPRSGALELRRALGGAEAG